MRISFGNKYKGKRVLITGHTGFKGSWLSVLSFEETVRLTAEWYKAYYSRHVDMYDFSRQQIRHYVSEASKQNLSWASGADKAW